MFKIKSISTNENLFSCAIRDVLSQIDSMKSIVRLVFFGNPKSNEEYEEQFSDIEKNIISIFGKNTPVVSYIAQKPLPNKTLSVEVYEFVGETMITYHRLTEDNYTNLCDYINIYTTKSHHLIIGGIRCRNNQQLEVSKQSDIVFCVIENILKKEIIDPKYITRQWNYIEGITNYDGKYQRYQAFNDSRTKFYQTTNWDYGYPAATGIGTTYGGVIIDLNVEVSIDESVKIYPIDNKLQIAAHSYSTEVLIGEEDRVLKTRSTPKFERAKSVEVNGKTSSIYISGTAAIRGEISLEQDISTQTIATIENIEYLISADNMKATLAQDIKNYNMNYCRVYMKYENDVDIAANIIRERYPNIDPVFVIADVCREELLIEIEGIAY